MQPGAIGNIAFSVLRVYLLGPGRLGSPEQQVWLLYRRFQIITQAQGAGLTIAHLHPLVAEDHPGLIMGIHEQCSIQALPIAGRNRPVADRQEGTLWAIGCQDLRPPADTFGLEAGEQVIASAVNMHFGCPEVAT